MTNKGTQDFSESYSGDNNLQEIAGLFWQFLNDRLDDSEYADDGVEMKPYIQPILNLINTAKNEARIDECKHFLDVYDTHKKYPTSGGGPGIRLWEIKDRIAELKQNKDTE